MVSPAAIRSACSCWSRHRSGPTAMNPRSALWPRTAKLTTWCSSAWADLTAATTASRSTAPDGALQNRWSTPHPVEGTMGAVGNLSGTTSVYGGG